MNNYHLSKTDFKIAQSCAAKLWYKKHQYPTATDQNEYMVMLADGGYMVGRMAQLLYPDGINIDGRTDGAIERTEKYLEKDNVILFEAAIQSEHKLIRADILEKRGNTFHLIEVKSKSFDSIKHSEKKGKYFDSDWTEYIEDIAYQKFVLQEKFPESKIECFLFLPDKAKNTPIEGLINWFQLKEVQKSPTFRGVEVEFTGDLKELQRGHILELVNVNREVEAVMNRVISNSKIYLDSLAKGQQIKPPISCACSHCEYTITDELHPISGFKECWGQLADVKPHILELGQLGNINRKADFKDGINELIKNKKVSINDVPIEAVTKPNGEPYLNNRPLYQRTKKSEFLLDGFKEEISDLKYPLHFIDFETSQMAIPYHRDMRPYAKVIFQWSCHTISKPGAEPVHSEWINADEVYPNFRFANALKNQVGDAGTLMTWSPYENTMLRDIFNSMIEKEIDDIELFNWLKTTAKHYKEDDTNIMDMNKLALKYYFHPMMGGRTSIKVTLPAVLHSSRSPRVEKWLRDENLLKKDDSGNLINPYELLPHLDIYEKAEKIKDGAGAMRAYQDMMYGKDSKNPSIHEQYRKGLLKYCKLDTLAMVIIWEHWMDLIS